MTKKWYVYIVECSDNSFYVGISNNLEARMKAHASGRGSRYVLSRGFLKLIGKRECSSRSEALKIEYRIKKMPRKDKLKWFLLEKF